MIKKLQQSEGRYLGYEVYGNIENNQERFWIADIEAALEIHAKVCVLLVLDPAAGWGIRAGLDDIKWVLKHINGLEKVGIVTDDTVWQWLISIDSQFARLVGIEEKYFKIQQIEEAWTWLKEK